MRSERPLRRLVFFIGGYDLKSPDAFFSRMAREVATHDRLWNASTAISPVETINEDVSVVRLESVGEADGRAWRSDTQFHYLCPDRAIMPDAALSLPMRLLRYFKAFSDFVATGTASRILSASRRYALFLIYPIASIIGMALIGLAAGLWMAGSIGLAAIVPAIAIVLALLLWRGSRWPLNQMMDLCSFVSEWAHQQRPIEDAMTRRFAAVIAETVAREPADEVLLIGHSAGGILILDTAARCLEIDPDFSVRSPRTTIVTIGSIALQAGLHPAATRLRNRVGRLAQDPRISWADIQCRIDPINFFHDDPAGLMGVAARRDFPVIGHIKVREMIEPGRYRRMRYNVFRIHYQFVSANTLPFWYDFYMVLCGPTLLLERARGLIVGPFGPDQECIGNSQPLVHRPGDSLASFQ